ncbi:AT-rich interactive domain-containing protein 4B isoform X2 [Amborella trichopoda]|uniref:AT-rich interactive domain-containing protein 4B isoform X2 n=1 Tax=Amborella trichopoda TaxID=13333 RepID=UPI0005D3C60E|nr:AT-rich interactive domain-containing protein 4B isoform X2 [Amborella trichopoda]|eukprot:XP_011627759.1 AT-rich interactive domain-containing protein 4B isoform X2 [Amborella trichopoda]
MGSDLEDLAQPSGTLSPVSRRKFKRLKRLPQLDSLTSKSPIASKTPDPITPPSLTDRNIADSPSKLSENTVFRESMESMDSDDPLEVSETARFAESMDPIGSHNPKKVNEPTGSGNSMDFMGSDTVFAGEDNISDKKKENNNKKKKLKDGNRGSKPSLRNQKRLEKERRAHLEQIHAESQRLLRETKDVSFKPVLAEKKPISSVLEKIRRRKLEVQRRLGVEIIDSEDRHNVACEDVGYKDSDNHNIDQQAATFNERHDDGKPIEIKNIQCHHNDVLLAGSSGPQTLEDQAENVLPNVDLLCDSQHSIEENAAHLTSSPETAPASSLLPMNLMFDSAPPEDVFSDEENDKENIDPHPKKPANMDLCPKGDPLKAFMDVEAEEEDDSDHDRERYHDDEEEGEEDDENFDDLIATAAEEMPIDREMRDQLHQKWLEEQDAAATDNVLQKLKCGWKEKDLERERDLDQILGDEGYEGSDGYSADDMGLKKSSRKGLKKAKLMINEIFKDEEDAFVSSDDEEMEQRMVRQRLLEQTEQTTFLSPADDDGSREVFGLIKKLNIAPESKKRTRPAPSSFESWFSGGNSNSSSKSSFLGRASSNSLQSSHKQGSKTVRSFIFGRDDSNSRSGISASDVLESDQKENRPPTNASMKQSLSQLNHKNGHEKKNIKSDTTSGSSLFEILKRSSVPSVSSHENNETLHYFQAFKSVGKSANRK